MKKTESPILEAVGETAKRLYEAKAIDRVTMREFDRMCLSLALTLGQQMLTAKPPRENR